jgi:hypothetical protein
MNEEAPKIAEDLLRGADAIAEFFYGDKKQRRRIYHLIASSHFPHFKLGSMICARKSILLTWILEQEGHHTGQGRKQA